MLRAGCTLGGELGFAIHICVMDGEEGHGENWQTLAL